MAIKRSTRKRLVTGGGVALCAFIYLIMFLPIAIVVANSFNATTASPYLTWRGFSLDWYVQLFRNRSLLSAFSTTLVLGLVSMAISTVLGTLAAVGMYRYRFRGKGVINGMLIIPVVIPEIVMGISSLVMFTQVHLPQGMLTLVLAHVTFCIPFVIFNVRARFDEYDPSAEEASMDLGAGKVRTFLNVTLPMLAPGILSGALLAFSMSIDDMVISYFVSGQTMTFPLLVFQSVRTGVRPDVNALSTLILLVTIIGFALVYLKVPTRVAASLSRRRASRAMSRTATK